MHPLRQAPVPMQQPTPKSQIHVNVAVLEDKCAQEQTLEVLSPLSRLQTIMAIFQLCGVNLAWSISNGLVIISLPQLTVDLSLPESLAFWPSSIQGLATASTLLFAGGVADVLGPRMVNLTGCLTNGVFMVSIGFVKNGKEFVVLRALQGVTIALHLASSVALVSSTQPRGRCRNLSFACLGLSQLLGFTLGLIIGGVLVDRIGWRLGWYLCGGMALLLFVVGMWALPESTLPGCLRATVRSLRLRVDWVGTLLASAFMALLSYFLSIIGTDAHRIKEVGSILVLCLCLVTVPLFIGWMGFQVKRNKPALIPNGLWSNGAFAAVCVTIALSFAALNSMDLMTSLYFQEIQHLSALDAAIRILPSAIMGVALNLATGFIVDKLPAFWLMAGATLLSSGSPLLMALVKPEWPYWTGAFFAQLLLPFSFDILFTVGHLIITEAFPEESQCRAGAVFHTAAQFGNAVGLATTQAVSTSFTKKYSHLEYSQALLVGFRAGFWAILAQSLLCLLVGVIGLRKAGKVGLADNRALSSSL
ncbi:uncharacterized protein FIESC28_05773 [Fusarium coffeatum]|uniref:Major facilitator superfamily (MFS) profile domain-containing protein n=1 Tax=Fusarium coffeatum TaxID=231269 RepID=A0A366RPA9_9HYPO|nr:uncharacterized protein FIESC28_05773 [Fusarium coffeatum]RBR18951.1 hypothetical protein FIESC28_05773 [Fusarium coffeatum]